MLIVSTGMYRSGSTWLFNALRLLTNHLDMYSCYEGDYDPDNGSAFHLVKTQRYREHLSEEADVVISIYRDIKETKASMTRRKKYAQEGFTNETNVAGFDKFFHHTMLWNMEASAIVDYRQMIEDPAAVLEGLDDLLVVRFCRRGYNRPERDYEAIAEELRNLKTPSKGFDPITLMHANHVTKKPGT